MSMDREPKTPTRLDSQETRVEVEEHDSTDGFPRFSFNQASLPENTYNPATRRSSPTPNLKASSPIPGSYNKERFGGVPWRCGDPYRYGPPKTGDSWSKCHELTEKYDNAMCEAWKEEVDKLLIFAGLFSATVTAFTVEAYKWLAQTNDDTSVRLLAIIASQSNNISIPSQLIPAPFSVSSSEVRISAAWFLSLTLALSTVLIGIMCLQWLREYQRHAALPHKESIALRQMRYEGLIAWHVPEILSALPLILQAALVLFFVGLMDLLWARNIIVASCVSTVIGIVLIFLIITTALPTLQHAFVSNKHLRVPQCPYKSPQSWLAYRLGHSLFWFFNSLNWSTSTDSSSDSSHRIHRLVKSSSDLNWLTFDMRWRQLRDAQEVIRGTAKNPSDSQDIIQALRWINDTFTTQTVEAVYPVYHCIAHLDLSAAAHTVSGFYLDGLIDNATLRVMMDDRFSTTEEQKRDVLAVYYLRLHQDRQGHAGKAVLKASYVESLLRILNSQEVPRPFYDWLSEVLQEMALRLPSRQEELSSSSSSGDNHTTKSFSLLNPEVIVQVLLCMKTLMRRDGGIGLRIMDLVIAWALIHHLLSPTTGTQVDDDDASDSANRMTNVNVNMDHLKLACGMFEEFENWITQGREIERCDRVKLCTEGMITVFSPSLVLDINASLSGEDEEDEREGIFSKASSLIRTLTAQMETLGGPSVVLSREKRWWLEYWEAYTEKDWEDIVESFTKIG